MKIPDYDYIIIKIPYEPIDSFIIGYLVDDCHYLWVFTILHQGNLIIIGFNKKYKQAVKNHVIIKMNELVHSDYITEYIFTKI